MLNSVVQSPIQRTHFRTTRGWVVKSYFFGIRRNTRMNLAESIIEYRKLHSKFSLGRLDSRQWSTHNNELGIDNFLSSVSYEMRQTSERRNEIKHRFQSFRAEFRERFVKFVNFLSQTSLSVIETAQNTGRVVSTTGHVQKMWAGVEAFSDG